MFAEVPKFDAPAAVPAPAAAGEAPVEIAGGRFQKGHKYHPRRSQATRERRMASLMRKRSSSRHRHRKSGYKIFRNLSPMSQALRLSRDLYKVRRYGPRRERKHKKNCPKGSNRQASGECKRRHPSPRRSPSREHAAEVRRSTRNRVQRVLMNMAAGGAPAPDAE